MFFLLFIIQTQDGLNYNETKRLLSNNAFSANEIKNDVVPEVPPRNVASRQRAVSLNNFFIKEINIYMITQLLMYIIYNNMIVILKI